MKLAILGGGGFRTPLMFDALMNDMGRPPVGEVWLHDTNGARLDVIGKVIDGMAAEAESADKPVPTVHVTTDLDAALRGADFVLLAIRVGGAAGRSLDERIAVEHGVVAQETIGASAISLGLRTVPVVHQIAEKIEELAPRAFVINVTNPAGMVVQVMQKVLGERVVGVCESPAALLRGVSSALELTEDEAWRARIDYVGINHLGWLRGVQLDGRDLLKELLADRERLNKLDEAHLFGADWLAHTGVIPNEVVYYYDFTREALEAQNTRSQTRAEYVEAQQHGFFEEVDAAAGAAEADDAAATALATWRRIRRERGETYMQDVRHGEERAQVNISRGGYERAVIALISALARGEQHRMIVNVRNGATLPKLPPDAVVEVTCRADAEGVTPMPTDPLPISGPLTGLTIQTKFSEMMVVEAALKGSFCDAVVAAATHPLIDSVSTARSLVTAYREAFPEIDALFGK